MPTFIPGLELCRRFYTEAVRPLLEEAAPGIPHSAARLGSGSEVLGFDTARSADHEWDPRLQLFLRSGDVSRHADRITHLLAERLPKTFHGYPTHFAPTGEANDIRVMRHTDGPVHHRVEVTHASAWFTATLGFDPTTTPITPTDWLATPTQLLAEVTGGAVFHDGLDVLTPARTALRWYPHDLWLHVLACLWQRLSQEEAFVGRCGEVGDELGSAVVTARQVRDLMRLCLLMDRRYPPYSKWLGSAFARTPAGARLTPTLTAALAATDWHTREQHLAAAYETVADLHNGLGLTDRVDPATRPYHSRPFRVLRAERFAEALVSRISEAAIRELPLVADLEREPLGTRARPGHCTYTE
ncbi:DUF4037 domain-containing protein [Streptomyces sp. NL15-2K]|uniref:DUF4037 domain-containing protein n=1 Tax=Streptomyces sp. NL15-2K TaxID=376149 RepID=UPI000F572C3B|nr:MULTISPECIES: DUF4037 domain-containing protein [Actinomycetes]WKX10329.1 DUF4037 domain-containing protein [Kutzneria buriramensis]GCB48172.1 hypothetical protein SNL152K_5496 [Streptomyces sp. NL15-2K]